MRHRASGRDVKRLEEQGNTPALMGLLRADGLDRKSTQRVAAALGRIGDPFAVDALLAACLDGVATVDALKALGDIGNRRAACSIGAMCSRWKDQGREGGSAGLMGRLRTETAAITLKRLLGDDIAGALRECLADTERGWQAYHREAWRPVEGWTECPLCGNSWAARVEGAAQCSHCHRYFSNFDRLTTAFDGTGGPFGLLSGTHIWTLTLTEKWLGYNDEREAQDLVRLPQVVPWMLTPTVESPVAWQLDESLMRAALAGGPDQPPACPHL